MWTRSFWRQVGERCIKSAAQALVGMWALDGFNTLDADWKLAFGVATGAAVLSLLTSLITAGIGEPDSPSAVAIEDAPRLPDRPAPGATDIA